MTAHSPLLNINELEEGAARGVTNSQGAFFAVKKDGEIYVYRNICPHLGTPLEWQEDQFLDADGALIQCASHGALFVIESGECVSGPCAGQSLIAVSFSIENDQILLKSSQ